MTGKSKLKAQTSALVVALGLTTCASGNAPAPTKLDLGITEADALRILGRPDKTTTMTMEDGLTFIRHIFIKADLSILIDSERDLVCETASADGSDGYCYPCDYGPSAGTCP